MDDDAALDRGQPQPRDEELAGDDRRHHPARKDPLADEDDERRDHEHLVRDRVEQRAERGRPPYRRATQPSNQSVAIATTKSAVAQ